MIKSLLYAANLLMMVFITGLVAAWQLGEWTPHEPSQGSYSPPPSDTPRPQHMGSGRLFVLFVESLRDKTARQPDLMPHLSSMQDRSIYGTLNTVYDAATEPALIAAFCGYEPKKALGILQSFLNPDLRIPSLFTVAKHYGLKSVVYSDYQTFGVFRDDLTERRSRAEPSSSPSASSFERIPSALDEFLKGDIPLMVYHIDELDAVAHRRGVDHDDYKNTALKIDLIIKKLDQSIPPQDTFLVFGDHGHNEVGRHSLGLNVPTFFLARGFGISPQELNRHSLTEMYELMARTLKIPPTPLERHPTQPYIISDLPHQTDAPLSIWYASSAVIGIMGFLWWKISKTITEWPNLPPYSSSSLSWLALQALFAIGLGLLFFSLGQAISMFSPLLKPPPLHIINKFWLTSLIIVWFMVPGRSAASLGLMFFIIPFFLLVPNFYRYGAPGVFAPAWIIWSIAIGREILSGKAPKTAQLNPYKVIFTIGILIFILQLFFFAEGQKQFSSWFTPLIAEITPTSVFAKSLFGAIIAFLLIDRTKEQSTVRILAILFALYTLLVHMRILPHGGPLEILAASLMLLASFLLISPLKIGSLFKESHHQAKALYLISMLLLTFEVLRLNLDTRINLLFIFLAIRLSLKLIAWSQASSNDKSNHILFLALAGFVGVGWITLGWGFSRLDWGPLFDYVPPEIVGRKMGHFLPLILIRFTLPIMVLRTLLQESCQNAFSFPASKLAMLLAFKYLSLLLIVMGIGYHQPGSLMYFEAIAQIGVFIILSVGFL